MKQEYGSIRNSSGPQGEMLIMHIYMEVILLENPHNILEMSSVLSLLPVMFAILLICIALENYLVEHDST